MPGGPSPGRPAPLRPLLLLLCALASGTRGSAPGGWPRPPRPCGPRFRGLRCAGRGPRPWVGGGWAGGEPRPGSPLQPARPGKESFARRLPPGAARLPRTSSPRGGRSAVAARRAQGDPLRGARRAGPRGRAPPRVALGPCTSCPPAWRRQESRGAERPPSPRVRPPVRRAWPASSSRPLGRRGTQERGAQGTPGPARRELHGGRWQTVRTGSRGRRGEEGGAWQAGENHAIAGLGLRAQQPGDLTPHWKDGGREAGKAFRAECSEPSNQVLKVWGTQEGSS